MFIAQPGRVQSAHQRARLPTTMTLASWVLTACSGGEVAPNYKLGNAGIAGGSSVHFVGGGAGASGGAAAGHGANADRGGILGAGGNQSATRSVNAASGMFGKGGDHSGGMPQSDNGSSMPKLSVAGAGGACGAVGAACASGAGAMTSSANAGESGAPGAVGANCISASDCPLATECSKVECVGDRCTETKRADGTQCNDGNVCTQADQCLAGECVGVPRPSIAAIVASVSLYGGYRSEERQAVQGLATLLGQDRIVFADRLNRGAGPTALTLVQAQSHGLELVDRVLSAQRIEYANAGGLDWTPRLHGFLVPAGASRFAFVSTRSGIEVYDVEQSKLSLRSSLAFAANDPLIYGAAASAGKIWTCVPTGIQSYGISEDGLTSISEAISVPYGCRAMAVPVEGKTIFVSNTQGVFAVALSLDPPGVTHQTEDITRLESLTADGEYVAGIRLMAAGAAGTAFVFRASDLSLVAQLEGDSGNKPTSVALLDGELLVRAARANESDSWVTLDRYAIHTDELILRLSHNLRTSLRTFDAGTSGNLVPSASRDDLIAVQPWRDILRVSATGFIPLTGRAHGALEQLTASSDAILEGFGPDSVYRLDIGDPSHPNIMDGGRILGHDLKRIRLLTGAAPSRLINVAELQAPVDFAESSTAITRIVSDGASLPVASGVMTLDGGPSVLTSAGGSLFQVSPGNLDQYRVRRYGAQAGLQTTGDVTLTSDFDRSFSVKPPADLANRVGWNFIASDQGDAVVLAEYRSGASSTDHDGWVSLLSLDRTGDSAVVSTRTLTPTIVGIDGDRILVVSYSSLEAFRFDGSALVSVAQRSELKGREIRRILRWDSEHAVLATLEWKGSLGASGVWVLSSKNLEELAFIETEDEILSMQQTDAHWIFAAKTGITLASPACP